MNRAQLEQLLAARQDRLASVKSGLTAIMDLDAFDELFESNPEVEQAQLEFEIAQLQKQIAAL